MHQLIPFKGVAGGKSAHAKPIIDHDRVRVWDVIKNIEPRPGDPAEGHGCQNLRPVQHQWLTLTTGI